MTATTECLTLDDYLTYQDGTDTRYELVNGNLVAMAQPKGRHGAIAEFLNDTFRAEIKRLRREWTSKQMAVSRTSTKKEASQAQTASSPRTSPTSSSLSMRYLLLSNLYANSPTFLVVGATINKSG
ncbi:MAG: Uma2 family endonuclease [Leptolyngbyaceae cyanobacterium]